MLHDIYFIGRQLKQATVSYTYSIIDSEPRPGRYRVGWVKTPHDINFNISEAAHKVSINTGRTYSNCPTAALAIILFYPERRDVSTFSVAQSLALLYGTITSPDHIKNDREWMETFFPYFSKYYDCLPHQLATLKYHRHTHF